MLDRGKRRTSKRKKQPEWDGIYLVESALGEQRESRWWTLLCKGVIVYLLVAGAVDAVLSALQSSYHPIIVQAVTAVTALFLVSLYYRKAWENLGYLLFFVIMAGVGFAGQNYISSGFYRVLNDLMEDSAAFFDSNAMRSYGETVGNASLSVTIAMSYISAVACLLVNILISRKMRYSLVIVASAIGIGIPLYLQEEPSWISVFQLLCGFLLARMLEKAGHYDLHTSNDRYEWKKGRLRYVYAGRTVMQAGICTLALTACVLAVCAVIFPQDKFHDKHPDNAWKKSTMGTMENFYIFGFAGLFNYYDNTGGLTSGRLGGISSIRLDYETDLRLTFAPYDENRFYLRRFVGQSYLAGQNRWASAQIQHYINAYEAKLAFYSSKPYVGFGVAEVENVAADSGVYLPYYSTDYDAAVYPGRMQKYTYYTSGDNFASTPVMQEYTGDWLEIPSANEKAIAELVKDAGLSGSPEQITQQLETYFQKEIPYSYQPGITPYGQDFVNYFLQKNRKGYCAHFASAATLAFRYMGIPARYVEGYAVDPDDLAEEGEVRTDKKVKDYYQGYTKLKQTGVVTVDVTDANAHAWVEIYVKGKGWQVADVTPASLADDEPGQNIWSMFMGLFGRNGRNNDTGNTDGTTTNVVKQLQDSGKVATGAFLAIVLLFVIVLCGRIIVRYILWRIHYRNAGENDRLIMEYQRYIQRIQKKEKGLKKAVNYEEQIAYLRKQGIWTLDRRERDRLLRLLEQAGFGQREITKEDAAWMRRFWKRSHRS